METEHYPLWQKWKKRLMTTGASVGNTPIPVENKTAVFVNDFHADSATTSILAKKCMQMKAGESVEKRNV